MRKLSQSLSSKRLLKRKLHRSLKSPSRLPRRRTRRLRMPRPRTKMQLRTPKSRSQLPNVVKMALSSSEEEEEARGAREVAEVEEAEGPGVDLEPPSIETVRTRRASSLSRQMVKSQEEEGTEEAEVATEAEVRTEEEVEEKDHQERMVRTSTRRSRPRQKSLRLLRKPRSELPLFERYEHFLEAIRMD